MKQSGELVRLTAEDMKVSFGDVFALVWELNGGFQTSVLAGLDAVHSSIVDGIGSAWEEMFGEANSLLEIFIKNFVEQLGSNVVQSAISGLLSLIPGGGFLASIFGGLFHEGGTIPKAHDGAYINASPSREFPILVRGGETIRTEAQEAALQRQGSEGLLGLRSDIRELTRTVKNNRPVLYAAGVVSPGDMMATNQIEVNRRLTRNRR